MCAAVAASLAPSGALAQKVLGYKDCEKCHKAAVTQWSRDEPRKLGADAHFATQQQLQAPDAKKFAAALGLSDPASPTGRCAACHATLVRGRIRTGVSCESCHGAASGYLEVHDKEPLAASYKKSLPLGLKDLHKNPSAIAKMCVDCHVTPEPALAKAGHPNGADFDAGASLQKIVHWTSAYTPDGTEHAAYDYGAVTTAGRSVAGRILAGGGASAPARRAAVPAGPTNQRTVAAPAAPSGPTAAPWDWSQVKPLPDDFPSSTPVPAAAAPAPTPLPRSAFPRPAPAAPSIVEDLPFATASIPQSATDEQPDAPAAEPPPASPAAKLARLRGEAAVLLARLLETGERLPNIDAPAEPSQFAGPDGELLYLQDVILYLALETLRKPE